MSKLLLFFFMAVGLYFAHSILDDDIVNIKQKNTELFSGEIEPYKVIEGYDSPTGLSRDIEDNSKWYYTKEDQIILDERNRILGPLPLLNGTSLVLSIGSAIAFIVLLYFKIDDWREERLEKRRIESNKKKKDAEDERLYRINQAFIEKVENIIESHESLGTAMAYREVQEIRTEMNSTFNLFLNTKSKAEEMISRHMKAYNPKWK
jgi:hypothetical protein